MSVAAGHDAEEDIETVPSLPNTMDDWLSVLVQAIRSSADEGHAKSQLVYARILESGVGVPEADPVGAFRYFTLAAENGERDAHGFRALCYLNGTGVEKNHDTALEELKNVVEVSPRPEWIFLYARRLEAKGRISDSLEYYKMAADAGRPDAQMKYACYLGYGHGCVEDLTEAYRYLKMAADQGHAPAEYECGVLLAKGDSPLGERNLPLAVAYLKDAARQQHLLAEVAYARANAQLMKEQAGGGCCLLI
jgi:TPR repeat protein